MKIIETRPDPTPPPPKTYVVEMSEADMLFIATASFLHEAGPWSVYQGLAQDVRERVDAGERSSNYRVRS